MIKQINYSMQNKFAHLYTTGVDIEEIKERLPNYQIVRIEESYKCIMITLKRISDMDIKEKIQEAIKLLKQVNEDID